MSRSKEIIYWLEGTEPPEDIADPLDGGGYDIVTYNDIQDVINHAKAKPPTMIVVDAATDESAANRRIGEILNNAALHRHPLAVIAVDAERKTSGLKGKVSNLLALDFPYEARTALEQIFAFVWLADSADPEAQLSRESLERQYDPLRLVGSYGGIMFGGGSALENFHDELLYPPHPNLSELRGLVVQLTGRDEWMGLHARRTAFVAAAIASGLGLPEERANNIRTTALLLSCGIQEKMADDNRFDLTLDFSDNMLIKVSTGYQMSANLARDKLKDERAVETIMSMTELMFGEASGADEALIEDAKCVYMVEVADRACWTSGSWEPRGAHRTMRLLDDKFAHMTTKLFTNSLLRVFIESLYLLDEMTPQRYRELFPAADEHTNSAIVELCDLTPGMKTLQPIISRAGTQVLDRGIRLKPDIIERIWRLGLATPFRSPLIEVQFGDPGEDH